MGVADCVLACFGPLMRYVASPHDTKDEKLRKNLFIPVTCICVPTLSLFLYGAFSRDAIGSVAVITMEVLTMSFVFFYVVVTKRLPQYVAGIAVVVYATPFVATDVLTYGEVEYYTGCVLVMDVLLLCQCHNYYTFYILALALVVIVLTWAEQVYRAFGLFDAIPESWMGYERPPPKQKAVGINLLLQRLVVFIMDFAMTRYFSKGMREQRDHVERSVVVAQKIAAALARFDLEKAQEMVEGADGLPLELLEAFSCLLGNLRSYKPYLPQSCLPDEVESDTDDNGSVVLVARQYSSEKSSVASVHVHTPKCEYKSATLLQSNICCFMDVEAERMADFHTEYISRVLAAVRGSRGLVEHFLCDRVLVSFNAAKPCGSHRLQALACVSDLRRIEAELSASVSIGVTSGKVLSGPLGCEGLRSYSLVGAAAAWVPLMERVAKRLSVAAVTDTSVYDTTKESYSFRLLGKARFQKGLRAVVGDMELFEYLGRKQVSEEEWMYQLAKEDPWDVYNMVRRLLQSGDVAGACSLSKELSRDGSHNLQLREEVERAARGDCPAPSTWVVTDIGMEGFDE